MAYNQEPGRGNFPKTGNGLPGTFRQDTDPPTGITKTPKFTQGVETYQKKLVNENQGRSDINVNPSTAEASAKPFERKIVNEPYGMTRIIGSGGQTFYGRTDSKETKDAINASNKKVEETNMRRKTNENFWNVNAGVKSSSQYTEKDKEMLVGLGKAKKS